MWDLRRTAICSFVASIGLLLPLYIFGFVGFHFPYLIDNDPYRHPVTVVRIADDRVEFADGRSLWLAGGVDKALQEKIEALAFRVDLESDPETSFVSLLGKKKHFICGMSMPTIII